MFTIRKYTKLGLIAGAALALAVAFGTVGSSNVSADDHGDRNAAMKSLGGAMKALGGAVAAGNASAAQAAAAKISETAAKIPGMFKDGKAAHRSKPEIWTNFGDFYAKANNLKIAADGVAADAAAGKLGSDPKAVVGKIGATCGACHKVYRGPKV